MKKKNFCLVIMIIAIVKISLAQSIDSVDSLGRKIVNLDEVVVKAALVKHDSRSDEYILTPELRQGATSVYDVFSRLPGVAYNSINNSLSVRMDYNVIIEVNGKRVSPEYIMALPIDHISKIQVIYVPTARYATEGIRYVINIKLKNDFVGHNLYVGNFTMISAGDNNGSNIIANEQPKAQYIYSGEKIDVTVGYGFATINWNYPISYSRCYNGIASIKSKDVNSKNPNDCNSTISNAANLGVDWQIVPHQTLSFRTTFQNDGVKHHSDYNIIANEISHESISKYIESSDESSKVNDIAGAVYYQGLFNNGWSMYSALGYNRMRDNISSEYSGFNFNNASLYRNVKDYFRGELDINYSFNDALALNFGYRGIWTRYMTHDRENGSPLSKYEDERHNGYVFFDWTPKDNILFHVGSGIEAIQNNGYERRRNLLEFLPHVTASWQPADNVQFVTEYTTKMEYPSLYQVSLTPTSIDRWLLQLGNPQLLSSRLQTVSLQASLFESLIIGAEYIYGHNSITDWYEKGDDNVFFKTYANAKKREFRAVVAYDWTITKELTWNNIIQWQWQEISGFGLSNHTTNLSWHSNLEYWIKPISLITKVEYMREMQKNPLLQGWQQYGQDLWQFSLKKSLVNNTLAISLNYVPPIHLGVRSNQESVINTSCFNQRQKLNLHTYDNLLMLRIEWRFNKGRNKQRRVQQYEFDLERKIDNGLL